MTLMSNVGRRGANWTPPSGTTATCFIAYDGGETCSTCGKHIAHHLGGTEYRCKPLEEITFQHDLKQPCACKTCETQLRLDAEAHAKRLAEEAKLSQERPTLDLRLDEPAVDNWVTCPACGNRHPLSFMGSGVCGFCAAEQAKGKPDVVNHPPHYKSGGLEVFDVLRAFGLLKSFTLGNVVKYVLRAGRKGDALEDLKKARWYLDAEIAEREAANKP